MPAYAESSLIACEENPDCYALLKPAVTAPTDAGEATTITTSNGTSVEAAGEPAVVEEPGSQPGTQPEPKQCSAPNAPCAPWLYWNQSLNGQAQKLAQQKYCAANPNDAVCLPLSGQSPGVMYWAVATAVSIWNCQMLQNTYGFQLEYCDDSSGYASYYDLAHRVGAGIINLRGPVEFLGFRQALDQFNQGCWFMDVLTADGVISGRQVCNNGPWFPPPGKMKFAGMLRMDGQPEPGGNSPPPP